MKSTLFHFARCGALVVVAATITPGSGRALEPQKAVAEQQKPGSEQKKPDAASKPPVPKLAAPTEAKVTTEKAAAPSEVQQQFCLNNAESANDSRIAWQAAKLADLETKIKQRIGELEAKRAEYADWLKRRDEAMKQAEDGVVAIYARMRPDAAALQLAAMSDPMAAAVIAKLDSRTAGAILNEMEPGRAARLTATIVGPVALSDRKKS